MRHILLTTALLCGGAHAQFLTGNDLLTRLNSEIAVDRGLSMGYIMGVYDATLLVEHCPPNNVTAGQVRDMVAKSLYSGAAARHLPAEAFITYTLSAAWPCAKKGKGV
jgi:hypothetical protein